MLEFLRFKATYFGEEKLTREITFEDLNDDDKEVLLSGLHHIQEGADRMGRKILHFFNVHMGKGKLPSHVSYVAVLTVKCLWGRCLFLTTPIFIRFELHITLCITYWLPCQPHRRKGYVRARRDS